MQTTFESVATSSLCTTSSLLATTRRSGRIAGIWTFRRPWRANSPSSVDGAQLRTEGELFGLTSWVAVMLGQNAWPETMIRQSMRWTKPGSPTCWTGVSQSIGKRSTHFQAHLEFLQKSGAAPVSMPQ